MNMKGIKLPPSHQRSSTNVLQKNAHVSKQLDPHLLCLPTRRLKGAYAAASLVSGKGFIMRETGFSFPLPPSGKFVHWWLPTSASSQTESLRISIVLCHRNSLLSLFVLLIPEELPRKVFHSPLQRDSNPETGGGKEALGRRNTMEMKWHMGSRVLHKAAFL